jgi:hypothetical protein
MFRMPSLTGSGAPPGGQVVLDLFAPSGDLFGLYLGLPGMPLAFPPFRGTIWTDLATTVELTRGVLDASEHFVLTATVPADPALQGKVFVAHGLTGLPARGFLLSNPTALVVD